MGKKEKREAARRRAEAARREAEAADVSKSTTEPIVRR